MKNKNSDDNAQSLLRKLSTKTQQEKRQDALRILQRKTVQTKQNQSWWTRFLKMRSIMFEQRKKYFFQQSRLAENRHIVMITLFFLGAVWISWRMEDKYDKMRERVKGSKSQQKIQIQKENQYIQKMLQKNPFEPVPIEEQEAENNKYLFEQADIEFDTRADLMEILQREKGDKNEE